MISTISPSPQFGAPVSRSGSPLLRRSWLVVPAHRLDLMAAAITKQPDIVVLDLVEFVSSADRADAHRLVGPAIDAVRATGTPAFIQVRPGTAIEDLQAAVVSGLNGVVVAGLTSPAEVVEIDTALAELEVLRNIDHGSLEIVASIETAPGNSAAYEISVSSARITALTLGRADLVMGLRPEPSGEIHLLGHLLQRLVLVARASRRTSLGAWWRVPSRGLLAGHEATLAAARRGRVTGCSGSFCLTGEQIEPINQAYGPLP